MHPVSQRNLSWKQVNPCTTEMTFRTERKVPRLGVMLVGWGGNNGTTVTAAVLANKLGLTWRTKTGLKVRWMQSQLCYDKHLANYIFLSRSDNKKVSSVRDVIAKRYTHPSSLCLSVNRFHSKTASNRSIPETVSRWCKSGMKRAPCPVLQI